MSYYIKTNLGAFVSGLYYSSAEAERAIDRYIAQQAKRYTTNDQKVKQTNHLRQSLTVEMNIDTTAPVEIIKIIEKEIFQRITNDTVGAVYSKPLLLSHIRTRIIGLNDQFWEVSPLMKEQAFLSLFLSGALIEKDGIITRSGEMVEYTMTTTGWYKSYLQRV